MSDVVDIQAQLEPVWIDQWFEYMRRKRDRERALIFLALITRYRLC